MQMLATYRRLLRNRALTQLLVGEFVSSIGDWLYLVALLIIIYAESKDPVLLGIVGAARVVPYVLLSIPAGMAADRYDRRLILLTTDLLRGGVMVLLVFISLVHGPLLAVIALAILATCFSSFFYPAIGALIPSLVTDETELGPANSAWASLDNLAFVIGPALAGLLIAAGGVSIAFALNAVSFAVIAFVLWRLPRAAATLKPPAESPAQGATAQEPKRSLLEELRAVGRPFTGIVLVNSAGSLAFGGLSMATVVLAYDVLHGGEEATGLLNAAIGVGGLAGALLSGALVLRRSLARPLLAGAVLFGLGLAVLGLVPQLGVAVIAMAGAALGSLLVDVTATTLFQRTVPDRIRGRALGVNHTAAIGMFAVGSLVGPILLKAIGAGPALVVLALVVVGGAVVGLSLVGAAAVQTPTVAPEAVRLSRVPIFAGLPTASLDEAMRRATVRSVAAGEVVIREGEAADRFYVIDEGSFAVTQAGAAGAEPQHLRTLGPDDIFGEIGLLTGRPRSATVTAETPGKLLVLEGSAFLELASAGPGVGGRLLGLYASAPATPEV